MTNTKAYKTIELLTSKELKNVESYLNSPYHNTDKSIVRLFKIIKSHIHKLKIGKETEWSKATICKKIQDKGKPISENSLSVYFSRLNALILRFISIEQLKKDRTLEIRSLIHFLAERGNFQSFEKQVNERRNNIENKPVRDFQYYEEMIWLTRKLIFHSGKQKNGTDLEELRKLTSLQYEYFVSESTKHKCEEHIINEVFNSPLLDQTMENQSPHPENRVVSPAHWIFQNLIHLNSNRNVLLYKEIKEYFINQLDTIGEEDKKFIFKYLLSFTRKKIQSGEDYFSKDGFDLFNQLIKTGLIYENGKIRPETFINCVINALVAKEFEWTNSFIEYYSDKLSGDHKSAVKKFSLSSYYYHQGLVINDKTNFQKALQLIAAIKKSNHFLELRLYSLHLRLLYELFEPKAQDFQYIEAKCQSFKRYLKKSKMKSELQEAYLKFNSIFLALVKVKDQEKIKSQQVEDLKSKINSTPNIALKQWFHKKVKELGIN